MTTTWIKRAKQARQTTKRQADIITHYPKPDGILSRVLPMLRPTAGQQDAPGTPILTLCHPLSELKLGLGFYLPSCEEHGRLDVTGEALRRWDKKAEYFIAPAMANLARKHVLPIADLEDGPGMGYIGPEASSNVLLASFIADHLKPKGESVAYLLGADHLEIVDSDDDLATEIIEERRMELDASWRKIPPMVWRGHWAGLRE